MIKHFKDIKAFEKRIQLAPEWHDYFMLGGRLYEIYEYGGGSLFHMDYDYVYFRNKRTGDMVYVKYDCPGYQYINGEQVQTKKYSLHEVELQESVEPWR